VFDPSRIDPSRIDLSRINLSRPPVVHRQKDGKE
jgi:hypothetical protein